MPSIPTVDPIQLTEGRFARLESIPWWDQTRLSEARLLVVGAGALGNEVLKNLALLGVGRVIVIDRDRVETSNLSRSVLFREADAGQPKAECAARGARALHPDLRIEAICGNVLTDLGLGCFRWADAVIGALDNREARVFVNSACARVGRPWFDGGIEVLRGVVRGFAPPRTACYQCTMSQVDWDLLNQRRSCSLLARRALMERGTPTTPISASVIGALQVAEVVKYLHHLDALLGRGWVFEGNDHGSYRVDYPIAPDCPWHEPPPPIESLRQFNSDTRLECLWREAAHRLGGLDALELARELVERLECPTCGRCERVLRQADQVRADQLRCPSCHQECAPVFRHSIEAGSELLRLTPRELGLPAWDILWARRHTACLGLELTGDARCL